MIQFKCFTRFILLTFIFIPVLSCNPNIKHYKMGTFGYDLGFFDRHGVSYLELTSEDGLSTNKDPVGNIFKLLWVGKANTIRILRGSAPGLFI